MSGTDTAFDDQDLLVFRPDTVGNYGSGTFHLLLDDVVSLLKIAPTAQGAKTSQGVE